jgi:hypothetical protein
MANYTTNLVVPNGGVSFESRRNSYRGSVSVNGTRYRTGYHTTRRGALRALAVLRQRILIEAMKPKSLRGLNNTTTSKRR